MMKVLYVTRKVEEIENTTRYQRIKGIAERCVLDVIALHPLPDRLRGVIRSFTLYCGRRFLFPAWFLWKLSKSDVDVVITPYLPSMIVLGWLAKIMANKKWVADIYDIPFLASDLNVRRRVSYFFVRPIVAHCLRRADHVMATLSKGALDQYKLSSERASYFTNGTDISLAERVIKNANLREKTKDRQTVVYVGHVLRVRGLELMLEAAQCMQAQGSGAKWVLIGPSRQADEEWLRKEVRHRGLSNIHYLGVLPHKEALQHILSADVCVCPFKKTEGTEYIYPIKVLEYMALGKAIVATDLQGIRRLIQHGESGLLFPDGDARAFYEAVAQLLQNRELRLQMGNKARERARAFDWKSIHDQWIRKLYEVVEGTPHER